MKTYIYNHIALLLGLTATFSCTSKIGTELPAPQPLEDQVTIKAEFVGEEKEPLTKVGANNGFSWTWSQGDEISVASGSDTKTFSITSGVGGKNAEFTGKAVEGDGPYTIQYPAGAAASASFAGQKQNGNGNVDHLKYYAMLSGVDAYDTFAFSNEWAQKHGGVFKQTGLLKIIMTLPDDVTTISKVAVAADEAVFYTGNSDTKAKKLEIELENVVVDSKHMVTVWMSTSWNEATVKAGEYLTVSFKAGDKTLERSMEFTKDGVLMAGKVNVFEIDGTAWTEGSHYQEGKGTESKPWVIYTLDELLCMKDDLVEGDIRYFELGADIDMSGVDWKPLNGAGSFGKQIHFDGKGHTLSNFYCSATAEYPSFFGVLYGTCKNVKFVNAFLDTRTSNIGILGGYGGTSGKPCVVENVHVQGKIDALDEATNTGGGTVGGLFGNARECTIDRCSADVDITSYGKNAGGIFALDKGAVTVRNCWTAGSIWCVSSICGGIAGELSIADNSIYNCFSTMAITTQFYYGGILGRAVGGTGTKATKTNVENITPNNHIEKCIAWSDSLRSNCTDGGEHYSNGAVVGATARKNYLTDCVRKADFNWGDCEINAQLGGYEPIDQENADPSHPLVQGSGKYATAYHGKASGTSETISAVAKRLGWDETIWDLSKSTPVLK